MEDHVMYPDQFDLIHSSSLYLEALEEFLFPLAEWKRVGACASRFSVNILRGIRSDAGCHDKKQFKRCVPLSSDSGISKILDCLHTFLHMSQYCLTLTGAVPLRFFLQTQSSSAWRCLKFILHGWTPSFVHVILVYQWCQCMYRKQCFRFP